MDFESLLASRGPLTRRGLLQVGSLALGGITLPQVLRADEQRRVNDGRATADSCIFVFLNGGPSHLDTWDMKPDAPPGIRGEFHDPLGRPHVLVPWSGPLRDVLA